MAPQLGVALGVGRPAAGLHDRRGGRRGRSSEAVHPAGERLEHLADVADTVDRGHGGQLARRRADRGDVVGRAGVDDPGPGVLEVGHDRAGQVVAEHLDEVAVVGLDEGAGPVGLRVPRSGVLEAVIGHLGPALRAAR